MNVEEITFGVEIETTIPVGTLAVGPHGRGADILQLPGWKADRDPSIRAGVGHEACEFDSPSSRGLRDFNESRLGLPAVGVGDPPRGQ